MKLGLYAATLVAIFLAGATDNAVVIFPMTLLAGALGFTSPYRTLIVLGVMLLGRDSFSLSGIIMLDYFAPTLLQRWWTLSSEHLIHPGLIVFYSLLALGAIVGWAVKLRFGGQPDLPPRVQPE